jgi:hypothetical protein
MLLNKLFSAIITVVTNNTIAKINFSIVKYVFYFTVKLLINKYLNHSKKLYSSHLTTIWVKKKITTA